MAKEETITELVIRIGEEVAEALKNAPSPWGVFSIDNPDLEEDLK